MATVGIIDINLDAAYWVVDCIENLGPRVQRRFQVRVPRAVRNTDGSLRTPTLQDFQTALREQYALLSLEERDQMRLGKVRERFVGKSFEVQQL